MELVEDKHRAAATMGLMIAVSIGEAGVGFFAIFINDWRNFHFFTSVFLFAMIPICWVMSESPRWMYMRKKYSEMYVLLKSIAKTNKCNIPSDIEVQLREAIKHKADTKPSNVPQVVQGAAEVCNDDKHTKESVPVNASQLILDPTLRIYTIVMILNWALIFCLSISLVILVAT